MVESKKKIAVKAKVKSIPKKKVFPFCFTDANQRLKALQLPIGHDFIRSDPVLHYMMENAENLFQPKMVVTSADWLETQPERGQDIKRYKEGGPNINWHSPIRANTIYLYIIDESIDVETGQKFQRYCEAYFYGVKVKLVRPGSKIKQK